MTLADWIGADTIGIAQIVSQQAVIVLVGAGVIRALPYALRAVGPGN